MHIQRLSFDTYPTLYSLCRAFLVAGALALTALTIIAAPACGKVTLGADAGVGAGECGNGVIEAGEVCDDGAESADCNADCTPAMCGDGVLNESAGETCDGPGGPNIQCDACTLTCVPGFDSCVANQAPCSTNTWNDQAHCGACNIQCGPGVACIDGGCGGAEPPKLVFVSSWVGYGDFGGAYVADDRCQGMAAQAGLSGQFMAWVSDANTWPSQRFNLSNSPYVLRDGTIIAQNWQDLTDGALSAPINMTEYGEPPQPWTGGQCDSGFLCPLVFTGTDPSGRVITDPDGTCSGWSHRNNLPGYAAGHSSRAATDWTMQAIGNRCDRGARLYCFEQ